MPDRTEAAHSFFFFFSSRRRHTRSLCYWSSDVCSSDLPPPTTSPASTGTCACLLPRFGSLCAPGQCDPARLPVPCRLQTKQLRVQPALRHQLLVRSLIDELTTLQHQDPVGHPHRGEAVRDEHRHPSGGELREA